jgi:hypothetical protein
MKNSSNSPTRLKPTSDLQVLVGIGEKIINLVLLTTERVDVRGWILFKFY